MATEFYYLDARRIKRRYHQKFRQKLISGINVTPFVDVVLVLLIVFMIAAPMMIVGVPVKLPKTAASTLPNHLEAPLEITLTGSGEYLVMNTPVKFNELISKLNEGYDIAVLSRYISGGGDKRDTLRVITSKAINLVCKMILRIKFNDFTSGIFLMKKDVGGDFVVKEKLLSAKTVITTGIGIPGSKLCVEALKALQNSIMFAPF